MRNQQRLPRIMLTVAALVVATVGILHGTALETTLQAIGGAEAFVRGNVTVVWLAVSSDLLVVALLWLWSAWRGGRGAVVAIATLIPLLQAISLAVNLDPLFPPVFMLGIASILAIAASLRMPK